METKKRTWMLWAIVALAIMNLSTIATIIYHNNQETGNQKNQQLTESESLNYSGRYFRDRLNLDREQMNQFRSFNPAFRQEVRSISINLENLRYRMLDEMSSEKSDTILLNILSDSIGILHSQLKRFTYRYYLEIKSICDKEQKLKLEQIFSDIYTGDFRKEQPGRGASRQHRGR
ncbi:MAG: hypothetical protein U0W24_08095 [Bacteroidales bacterium]